MGNSIPAGEPLRIVLIGKTGVGKSAVGNTILGRKNAFASRASANSVTEECKTHCISKPREIEVIDTPGILDTDVEEDKLKKEILNCIKKSCPGPHVFLLVIAVGRFTKEEHNAVIALQELFHKRASEHMIVLFTRGDDLAGQTIDEYVRDCHPKLREAIKSCGGRYHAFNNKSWFRSSQVVELVKIIDKMVNVNGGGHYTDEVYEDTQRVKNETKLDCNSQEFNAHLSLIDLLYRKVAAFVRILKKD